MFKNFNLMFFLVFLFPLLSFFYVDNLFLLWMVMEMQTLFFLVYMWNTVHNTNNLLYFLVIQMFCSGVLFFLIYVFTLSVEVFYLELLFQLVLFLKMGMFPFHGWALWFCETVPYSTFFLFLTGMKFLPLLLLTENNNHSYIWLFMLNIFFSSILVFFSLSYISILFFSSMFISSLLMFIGFLSSLDVLFLLFLTYTFLIFLLIFSMPFFSMSILDIASKNLSIFLFVLVMSMVGMPFSVGFLLKVLFLQVMNENLGIVLSFVLIFFHISYFKMFLYKNTMYMLYAGHHAWDIDFIFFMPCQLF